MRALLGSPRGAQWTVGSGSAYGWTLTVAAAKILLNSSTTIYLQASFKSSAAGHDDNVLVPVYSLMIHPANDVQVNQPTLPARTLFNYECGFRCISETDTYIIASISSFLPMRT